MCTAIRVGLNKELKELFDSGNAYLPWIDIFFLLIKTDFSIIEMIEKHNYKTYWKAEILKGFYEGFEKLSYDKPLLNKIFSEDLLKLYKERLLKVLLFSDIPKKEAEMLINDLFLTQDLDPIISYYRRLMNSSF